MRSSSVQGALGSGGSSSGSLEVALGSWTTASFCSVAQETGSHSGAWSSIPRLLRPGTLSRITLQSPSPAPTTSHPPVVLGGNVLRRPRRLPEQELREQHRRGIRPHLKGRAHSESRLVSAPARATRHAPPVALAHLELELGRDAPRRSRVGVRRFSRACLGRALSRAWPVLRGICRGLQLGKVWDQPAREKKARGERGLRGACSARATRTSLAHLAKRLRTVLAARPTMVLH